MDETETLIDVAETEANTTVEVIDLTLSELAQVGGGTTYILY